MRETLCEIFMDVLEVNIVVSAVFLIVFLLAGKLRKRYGAGWLKVVWILLAVRLLIPYNFALPSGIQLIDLFRTPAVETEEENDFQTGMQTDTGIQKESGKLEKKQDWDNQEVYHGQEKNEDMTDTADGTETNPYSAMVPDGEGEAFLNGKHPEPPGKTIDFSYDRETLILTIFIVIGMRSWLMGICMILSFHMVSYLYFSVKLKKSLQPVTDINVKRQITGQQKKLIGKVRLAVFQSTMVNSPMIVGIFTPKLILPAGREKWSETELEFVAAHELCHYRKKDLWLKMLMMAAWCVNWFNPLVFLLKRQFHYDMELACDGNVLSNCSVGEREDYARFMLSFAGKSNRDVSYSTGFSGSKKQMKRRIDYMLDDDRKRRGTMGIVMTGLIILTMGLLISCGYLQDEEENRNRDQIEADESSVPTGEQQNLAEGEDFQQADAGSEEVQNVPFDVNNEYNEMIRCYGDEVYIARTDGIYRLSDDGASEELLYANDYQIRRGMELYQDHLYFCGSAKRGDQDGATIYRMDLNTLEVEDALAVFSSVFDALYHITIYEDKLYVISGYGQRIGFELDESGIITVPLDTEAEDFLFKEDNEYWGLQLKIWNNEVEYDSEEYWDTVDQMSGMYRSLIDVAACERMLNGDHVVIKYKDEFFTSVYLKKKEGDYEFLCDVNSYPPLVTETGVYYFADGSNSVIWYVDYETKTRQKIWEREDRKYRETQLVNYDQEYIYFTASNEIGHDTENDRILRETYLMRIPRWQEGGAEKIYQFALEQYVGSLQLNCSAAGGKMFFNDYETISLDPVLNSMERLNSGEPSDDATAMKQTLEAFAAAYFHNDEDTLRSYLTEGFEGGIDLYPYPEQAGEIEEMYIFGLPDGNLPVRIRCPVSYEFSGNAETDGALSYLGAEMLKTDQGWKISSYGLEG